MTAAWKATAVALVLVGGLFGCGSSAAPTFEPDALRGRPLTRAELPTTTGALYIRNLTVKLDGADEAVRSRPADVDARHRLADLRYRMARYQGRIEGIAAAEAALSEALRLAPESAELHLARAKIRMTLHRFDAASTDIAAAAAAGADDDAIRSARTAVDLAVGRYHLAAPAIRATARTNPTPKTLAALADLELQAGRTELAMRAFEAAEDRIASPDPMFVAWLLVQRGRALLADDPQAALPFLDEAVARLPGYVAAEEHRAEALARLGREAEAIAAYEGAVATSADPEFMGALAELYSQRREHATATRWRTEATARYDVLIARYPEAMAWHAAGYFLGPGDDPARARDLLWLNAQHRPTPRAFLSLAAAAAAAL